jgi:VWFA-related protein
VAPAIAPQLEKSATRRTIVLLFDDIGIGPLKFSEMRLAVKKYIYEELKPGDLVALVRMTGASGALQQFTSDPQVLRHAVDNMTRWVGWRAGYVPGIGALDHASGEPGPDIGTWGPNSLTVVFLQVIKALAAMPGRKAVVYIGGGRAPSREIARTLADAANRSSVTVHVVDTEGLKTRASSVVPPEFEALASAKLIAATKSMPIMPTVDPFAYFRLNDLAEWTGGVTWRRNDMVLAIKEAVDDSAGYYLIGWYPGAGAFERKKAGPDYHPVQIKVRRSGLTVRTRDGFFGTPGAGGPDKGRSAEAQMAEALFSPFRSGDLDVGLTPSFQQNKELGPYLETLVHVGSRGIVFQEDAKGCRTANLEIVTWPLQLDPRLDSQGKATSRLAGFQFCGKTSERVIKDGIVCLVRDKAPKPGPYQARVAVRNAPPGSGHSVGSPQRAEAAVANADRVPVGSASRFLQVPDIEKQGLALSGILLGAEGALASVAAQPGAQELYRPTVEGDPAIRSFRAGGTLRYELRLFRATGASSQATVQTQIKILREGQEVYSGPPVPLDLKGVDPMQGTPVQGTYKLDAATVPAQYILGVIATEKQGGKQRTAEMWIDFEVVE